MDSKESSLIKFYRDEIPANKKKGYYFSDIIKWDDYKLETAHDFIQWLFPDSTGGVNPIAPHLTESDIEKFKTEKELKKKVTIATMTMLRFYGFTIREKKIVQIKPLKRFEQGIIVGLYSEHNYRRITRIMTFLNKINLEILSAFFMLAICHAMKKDDALKRKMFTANAVQYWLSLHKTKQKPFYGLRYRSNSCYLDSVLVSLFSSKNSFIDYNFFTKDISKIRKEVVCGQTERKDNQVRQAIRGELYRIAQTVRGKAETKVENCVSLRKLFVDCQTSQQFHSGSTQDAGEFLQFLFSLFQVEGTVKRVESYVTNKLDRLRDIQNIKKTKSEEQTVSPIILVPSNKIRSDKKISLYLTQTDDYVFDANNMFTFQGKKYCRRIEKSQIVDASIIIFYAQRLFTDGSNIERNYNKIGLEKYLTIPESNKRLKAFAFIVHESNHYTAYIRSGKTWYYYNDMSREIDTVGSWDELLKTDADSKGVLYFYG